MITISFEEDESRLIQSSLALSRGLGYDTTQKMKAFIDSYRPLYGNSNIDYYGPVAGNDLAYIYNVDEGTAFCVRNGLRIPRRINHSTIIKSVLSAERSERGLESGPSTRYHERQDEITNDYFYISPSYLDGNVIDLFLKEYIVRSKEKSAAIIAPLSKKLKYLKAQGYLIKKSKKKPELRPGGGVLGGNFGSGVDPVDWEEPPQPSQPLEGLRSRRRGRPSNTTAAPSPDFSFLNSFTTDENGNIIAR